MDYEQKYKHALDLAKQVHDTTISKQQKENIEIIFPELKESGDDEEIVKLADEYYDKVLIKECGMEGKEAHHCRLSYIHGAKAMLERQKWRPSEEQMIALDEASGIKTKSYCWGIRVTDIMDWLEKQGQKPAWSEEDEKMKDLIISVLEVKHSKGIFKVGLRAIRTEEIVSWLKSLKQRYTWKPSKEQMDAMQMAVSYFDYSWVSKEQKLLESLYKDLKKLTEG